MGVQWLNFLLVIGCLLQVTEAVDRSKFRTCQDTGFCRKYRSHTAPTDVERSFQIKKSTVSQSGGKITAQVHDPSKSSPLDLEVSFLKSGSVRVKVSETTPRWQPNDLLLPPSADLSTFQQITSVDKLPSAWKNRELNGFSAYSFSTTAQSQDSQVVVIQYSPLRIELFHNDVLSIVVNDRNLMHFEQQSMSNGQKVIDNEANANNFDRHQGKEVVDYGEDGLAIYSDGTREEKRTFEDVATPASTGESFGGHYDSMPNGPISVGMDISFPFAHHVYGIPEHTSPLSLPTTYPGSAGTPGHYSQPYRLYNLDVFEYELQETMALYGHIPLMWAHGKVADKQSTLTSGIFFFNPSESFIDIADGRGAASGQAYKETHWMFESGEIDLFLLPGPTPKEFTRQYASLTGSQALPPLFALGYHQCRWNYRDEKDVAGVNAQFESLDYPYDVIWLDIEHTDGKRYFTWDKQLFPTPLAMQQNITSFGRKMVTIIDPHIKRDDAYHIHRDATAKGLYIKTKDNTDFDGWCWPGSSSYLDFTTPKVRDWWRDQFQLDRYTESTLDLYTWNDMNEPSVFNGPEVSMQKDAKNLHGVEHREWHNLYGIYMQMATAAGQIHRAEVVAKGENTKKTRPFVLTRAFWAGSQRFGAMWTGDNKASWDHLKISVPMLLSINLGGLSFAGADVGGFFGDTNGELFTRWYQAGAFTPFFRGHAHHDSKRREPWVYGEPYTSINRHTAMVRYSLLPLWYTIFFEAYVTGHPVMRSLFLEFPEEESTFAIDDTWMVGDSLLVKPVTDANTNSVSVYFPPVRNTAVCADSSVEEKQLLPWYDLETLQPVMATAATHYRIQNYPADLKKIPVFIKPGKIIPRKMRLRRSSKTMYYDPYTLYITPGVCNTASGAVYVDDESSFAYQTDGSFKYRLVTFGNHQIRSQSGGDSFLAPGSTELLLSNPEYQHGNTVERIVLLGQQTAPKRIVLSFDVDEVTAPEKKITRELEFFMNSKDKTVTIKKPDVPISVDWVISLEY